MSWSNVMLTLTRPEGMPEALCGAFDACGRFLLEAISDSMLPRSSQWWARLGIHERYMRAFAVADATAFADGGFDDYDPRRVGGLSLDDLRRELVRAMVDPSFEPLAASRSWVALSGIDSSPYIVSPFILECDGGGSMSVAGSEYFSEGLAALEPRTSGYHLVIVRAHLGLHVHMLILLKPPGIEAAAGESLFRQAVSRCAPGR